jgi:hypothetical protein
MAKATKKKTRPRGAAWTGAMHAELRKHSKARNTNCEDLKADEADSWCTAPAGAKAGYRPRTPALNC